MKRSVERRCQALAEALADDPGSAAARFVTLLECLAEPAAPTTVHRPEEAADVHLADSLSGLAVEPLGTAGRVADLGAGAGLPGLALAAARPTLRFTAVESNARKAEFITQTAARMGLTNLTALPLRAEEWHEGRVACDAVTARAVAPLAVLVEYAAPLLVLGGVLVAWKGRVEEDERIDGAAAAALTGLEPAGVRDVKPFPSANHRSLHVFRKTGPTPERYPRRPGMAAKRPLSATKG